MFHCKNTFSPSLKGCGEVFIEPPSALTCAERDIRISVKNGEFDDCESPSINTAGDALISQLLKTVDKVKQGRKVIRSNMTIQNNPK